MLNGEDVSEYLKLSSDGLEVSVFSRWAAVAL